MRQKRDVAARKGISTKVWDMYGDEMAKGRDLEDSGELARGGGDKFRVSGSASRGT